MDHSKPHHPPGTAAPMANNATHQDLLDPGQAAAVDGRHSAPPRGEPPATKLPGSLDHHSAVAQAASEIGEAQENDATSKIAQTESRGFAQHAIGATGQRIEAIKGRFDQVTQQTSQQVSARPLTSVLVAAALGALGAFAAAAVVPSRDSRRRKLERRVRKWMR